MNDAKPHSEDAITDIVADLARLRDELHLKAHLARMEVRETWEALQPRLHELERDLEGPRAAASSALRRTAEHLRDRFIELRDAMRRDAEAGSS